MFIKMLKMLSFALIAHFASFTVANVIDTTFILPTTVTTTEQKNAFELIKDAETFCEGDTFSVYFSVALSEHNSSESALPSKYVCPAYCIINQLGLVNNNGLNKIIVQWMREYTDFLYKISPPEVLEKLSRDQQERGFSKIQKLVESKKVEEACAEKDEKTRDNRLVETYDSMSTMNDLPNVVPSEERSKIMELVRETIETCAPKYNTTLNHIYLFVSKTEKKSKENICAIQCMITSKSLGLFETNGLSKAFVDELQASDDTLSDVNDSVKRINELVSTMESECNSNFNELTNISAYETMNKVIMEFMSIVERF